jgi:signal transduction histidine kinase
MNESFSTADRNPQSHERAKLGGMFLIFAAFLVANAVSIGAIVYVASTGEDERIERHEVERAEAMVQAQMRALKRLTKDYSYWDDAVENLAIAPNRTWAEENLGSYLHKTFEIERAMVLDPAGRPIFTFQAGEARSPDVAVAGLGRIVQLAAAARRSSPNDPESVADFVRLDNDLMLVAAGAITRFRPLTDVADDPGPRSVLLLMYCIDAAYLSRLQADYAFAGLRLVAAGEKLDGRPVLPLRNSNDAAIAALTWDSQRPGYAVTRDMVPAVTLSLVLSLLAAAILYRRLHWAARTLDAARIAAEQASRAKSAFLATVSHELLTPLNAVIGFSEVLVRERHGPLGHDKYVGYVRHIFDSGNLLLRHVNEILNFAQADAGRLQLRFGIVPVRELIERVLSASSAPAEGMSIRIEVSADDGIPPVKADAHWIQDVLKRLLLNAIQASPPGSTVVVKAERDGADTVAISIADSGRGLPADARERMLLPFELGDDALNRRRAGLGLGLAISRAVVHRHGGTLSLESAEGHGTTVTVRLPAASPKGA